MADSVAIMSAILSLGAGAILIILANEMLTPVLSAAEPYTKGHEAAQATTWLQTAQDFLPIVFLLTTLLGLIVVAVYRRPAGV